MEEELKKNYPWLDEYNNEKFLKLWNINDEDVSFHCNNCNSDVAIVYMDDYCCPYCKAPKTSLTLIETQDFYKNRMEHGTNFLDFWYICNICKHNITKYKDIMELEEKEKVDATRIYCKECHQPYTMTELEENLMCCPNCLCSVEDEEEYDYTCENCYEQFTNIETENVKCPHCGYIHKNIEPVSDDDMEPDCELTEEDWEDIQFSDD